MYRRLFDARLVPSAKYLGEFFVRVHTFGPIMHTDDKRHLSLGASSTGSILIDTDNGNIHKFGDHVVYVSLRYGSVWARPKDEFEGQTNLRGTDEDPLMVPRFAPVPNPESIDVFAENERLGFETAIGKATQACRDVEQRYERLRKEQAISYAGEQILSAGSYAAEECMMAVASLLAERGKKK